VQKTLELCGSAREHPENLNFTLGAAEVVAAAAVVAAGLPAGRRSRRRSPGTMTT
jgi:hypothetical protein